ncbi:exocyst complex component EXO84B-like [Iris pallida]|uniref:Exocyst complex component EXO84B-like n=1 Tax=Iris pallida TaxID=29817 RepID=A0AAX6GGG6_IRIPA|nr:exocyst complex component EXO84B-like [Iris pallida]KAJ6827643.1 exocyst complex component EXO84B-like [Iris pallida]
MSSAKSSRSRASVPSGMISAGPGGGPDGGGAGAVQLADKLKIFKTDNFDADAYVQSKCQTMNEKEIRHLCSYLHDLKKASAEEMRRSVYANYASFIRTSKEISDLEGELLSIRNLLSNQAALLHNLAEGVHVDSLCTNSERSIADDISNIEDREPSAIETWLVEFPDTLDVLLAERRVDEALDALDEAERIAADAKGNKKLRPDDIMSLQTAITNRRQRLADQLAEAACQSSTHGVELRAAASALKRLGDGHRAHSLLLNAHSQRLQYNIQTLHPTSTSYGGAYTAALSQQVFSAIAQAVNDSLEVFGNESTYLSELVTWSTKQTEAFAHLVLRHALASSAAAGGLRAAAECVQIAIGHCSLLENRGLTLSSVLMNLFKPSVELALGANLKRIEESTAALAAADDWLLVYTPSAPRTSSRTSSATSNIQPKLSSSAHRFNSMVQDFFEDVGPLLSMQLGGSTLNGLLRVFNSYVNLLINALPGSMENEEILEGSGNKIVRMAETEMQQLALLANASLLAEELLPRAAMKLSPLFQVSATDEPRKKTSDRQNRMPEQREWKRKLQRSVDRLRDSFCRQHALDLIFTEDGDTHLSAEMYIYLDNVDDLDLSPSSIFQELFAKLNRMSTIAADMFVGRERFATLILMRLIETVILWLSEDQTFWEDIKEGPKPLGLQGLKQFYLDMQFIIVFGQGRYLSRHVHQVIIDIIDRAMNAFSATGRNPDDELPPDDFFIEIAQETLSRISGKYRMANGDREVHSPTASVSAQSMSSVRSHGSS